jgi:hypothetical protein
MDKECRVQRRRKKREGQEEVMHVCVYVRRNYGEIENI